MSDEKIDLHEVEQDVRFMYDAEVLALVAAVRAATKFRRHTSTVNARVLDAALAPFTDSAEVRSDGE